MPLPVGTPVKITTLRGNRGVWWGRITGIGVWKLYANIFAGPTFKTYGAYGSTYTPPIGRPWSIAREQYMEVPEWDPEFLIAQAAHALGVTQR